MDKFKVKIIPKDLNHISKNSVSSKISMKHTHKKEKLKIILHLSFGSPKETHKDEETLSIEQVSLTKQWQD